MTDKSSSESTILGWKFVVLFGAIGVIFLSFFYLAMSSEPDYMPGAQRKAQQQHEMQHTTEQPAENHAQHSDNMSNMDMPEHQHSQQ